MSPKKSIRSVGILVNAGQPRAQEVFRALSSFLRERGLKVLSNRDSRASGLAGVVGKSDLVVVLGGDGTLLNAAQAAASASKPLLGVNLGRLGYLTPVAVDEMLKVMDLALAGKLDVESRVMLRAEVKRAGRTVASLLALNDIVVTKGAVGRIVERR